METIVREKTTYGLVLFDKYILCDIKAYPASDINFRRLDEIDKKKAKIRQYNSLKVLRKEVPHHLKQWHYWLPKHKEDNCKWMEDKIEPWWDEINTLDSVLKEGGFTGVEALQELRCGDAAWNYCIEHKYFKIIKIKERLIFEE